VALGRALVKGSDLVFADEPSSALDWETGALVIGLLRDCAHEGGATILVVSHDARVGPYADQEFHLEDGSLVGVGPDEPPSGRQGGSSATHLIPAIPRNGIQRCWGGRGEQITENR
jgi:ABC-type lipoprotein export system ATPase subunit